MGYGTVPRTMCFHSTKEVSKAFGIYPKGTKQGRFHSTKEVSKDGGPGLSGHGAKCFHSTKEVSKGYNTCKKSLYGVPFPFH